MKFLSLLTILALVLSCSDDDPSTNLEEQPEETGFFNPDVLKVGNEWVYWHYEIEDYFEDPENIIYTGEIDSVKVIGTAEFNGIPFSLVQTRKFNSNGELESESISNERITPSTHWVRFGVDQNPEDEEYGAVIHPGEDWEYVWIRTFGIFGTIEYRLRENISLNIDGVTHEVRPYNGIFTPNEDHPELVSKTIEYNYNEDIGLISIVCPEHPYGTYYYGKRLKSFTPGP